MQNSPRGHSIAALWWVPGALVTAGCGLFYLRTLKPGLDYHDFGEMQVTATLLGVPHGAYSLYIWLGWLMTWVPVGTPAYRVNLLSAVCATGSVALVYELGLRLTSRQWWSQAGAAVASLIFGLSYTHWAIAVFAESYAPHVLLGLLVTWLAFRWIEEGRVGLLIGAFFLAGAMLSNHLSGLSLGPPLGLMLVSARWGELGWRRLVLGAGAYLGGVLFGNLLLFWLLWIHHSPWDHLHAAILANPDRFPFTNGQDTFWRGWWFNLGAMQYRGDLSPGAAWRWLQLRVLPHRFVAELSFLPMLGALIGAGLALRRHTAKALFLTGIVAAQTFLVTHHQSWKVGYYFVLPYACAAIFLAVFLSFLGELLVELLAGWPPRAALTLRAALAPVALVVLIGFAFWMDLRLVAPYRAWLRRVDPESEKIVGRSFEARPDESRDRRAEEEAHRLLAPVPDGSLVLADWGLLYPLVYVALVEKERPHVTFLEAYPAALGPWGFSEPRRAFLVEQLKQRKVFLAGDAAGAKGPYHLRPIAPGLTEIE